MLSLEEVAKACRPVFEEASVDRAYVYGSFARGEQTDTSDVDICFDRTPGSLFNFSAFLALKHALESALGLSVDLNETPSERTASSKVFLREFQRDGRLIYERSVF